MAVFEGLRDQLNDSSTNLVLWPASYMTSATYLESSNGVTFTCVGGTVGSNYTAYISGTWDLTESAVIVEVSQVTNGATTADTFLQIELDGSNRVNFVKEGTTLFAQKVVAGVKSNLGTVTYSATLHRWWRVRHTALTVYLDVSPDGRIWTNLGNELVSNLFAITALLADFGAGTFQSETSPGGATFANFNTPRGAKFNNRGLRPHPFSPGLAR